jgi:RND family efflux transporter MFP subunit
MNNKSAHKFKRILLTLLKTLPWIIILLAILVGYSIYQNGKASPRTTDQQKVKKLRIVNVAPLIRQDHRPQWHTSGTVIASEQVSLRAQVTGTIESINKQALPGVLLAKGALLAKINAKDHQLLVNTRQAQVVQAQSNLDIELGNQILAREEFAYLSEQLLNAQEQELVLRKPHIAAAQAKLHAAQAAAEQAKLDLERTQITMPFRGKLLQRSVGTGSKVTQNSELFKIVNVDQFWLEIKVPQSFMPLLDKNAPITISKSSRGKQQSRTGKIISILPNLDSRDRQVKLLIAIEDPLALNDNNQGLPPIYINDFLEGTINGKTFKNAWRVKSQWLTANNDIWVVDQQSLLQKRSVEILFKGREFTYVQGNFIKGDRALTDILPLAMENMPVKPRQQSPQQG